MSTEGRSNSYGRTYEPSIGRSGNLGPRGPEFASLAKNDGLTTIFDGASPTTPSGFGGLPARTPSSNDAQASLEASWEAPYIADKASEACVGESIVITVRLF